jgi:cephalosporin-C deacetylase-like acetyl esterase
MSARSLCWPAQFLGRLGLLGVVLLPYSHAEPGPAGDAHGPWDLTRLRKAPTVISIDEQPGLTSLYYEGEPFREKPTRVFAYLARPPKATGKLPAMVLVHGGGGTAFREWAELWGRRGYVALAMDLAGCGPNRKRLADGGPDQDDNTKFGFEELKDGWSYHAIADVIRGVSLLASLPEVDPERIGVTGISWGGYLTCIVAGLDDRLKVAIPVYGCGFLHDNSVWLPTFQKMPEGKRRRWVENFDPSRYLAQAKMPVLFVNGTNDFAYPLDSYQQSYRLVKDKVLCVTVNMPHGHPQGWAPVEIGLFADQYLGKGKPLPRIGKTTREENAVEVTFRAEVPVTSAALHFTTDLGPWKERKWQTRAARIDGMTVRAELPAARPLVYFVTLTDERKATVSTEHEVLPALDRGKGEEPPEDVVRLDAGVSGHIHPALCRTPKGTLIAVYCRAEYKPYLITRSTDAGKTWTKPAPFPHTVAMQVYPGSLTTLSDGRIVHCWNVWFDAAPKVRSRYVAYSISNDDGLTWSQPVNLDKAKPPTIESVIRHPLVELSANAWLLPLMDRTVVYNPEAKESKAFGDDRFHGLVPIVRTAKGTLISGKGLRSTDGGKTWEAIKPFPDVSSQGWRHEMLALKNGWVIASQIEGPGVGGNKIQFVVSRDDGRTWDLEHPVEFYNPGRAIGGRACPRTVQLDDAMLGTVFYDTDSKQDGGSGVFFRKTPISRLAGR